MNDRLTSIILDVIGVLLIGASALTAYFKGFVRTVLELLSVLFSCVLAAFATSHFAPRVCQQIVFPAISHAVSQYIPSGIEEQAAKIAASVPGELEEKFMESVGGVISQVALGIADAAGKQISQTLAESVTRIVLFLLFFVLFSIAFRIIIFVVDTIFHLPVLNLLNRVAGFMVGLVQGAILTGLFCIAVSFMVGAYRNSPKPLVCSKDVESTVVIHYIYDSSLIQPFLFDKGDTD